ncbi:unnamed protein product [Blepharisma stoltei]|uniref:Uncharacterized protein n=1 Tax=Blepharisma stoltei TaxID=1481888 RepID=A0AAU9J0L1_9CILI|nr:unnamed protein product [Blepharisma stoltei]
MDIPVILQNLKDYHHRAMERDEIQNFREDVISLINESAEKGLFNCTKNKEDYIQNIYTKKLNTLLPLARNQKLDLFGLLAKHLDSIRVIVNIPTTLLRIENISVPFLIQTLKNGAVVSRPCLDNDFFKLNQRKSDENGPIVCYKAKNKETLILNAVESAQAIWKSTKAPAMLQYYIQSYSNPASITRVLWKIGCKLKFYTIINRSKVKNKTKAESTNSTPKRMVRRMNRASSITPSMTPSKMLSKLTQSIVRKNPAEFPDLNDIHEEKTEILGNDSSLNLGEENEKSSPDLSLSKEFIVNSKIPDSCFGVENKGRIPEIEAMVSEVISFLNTKVFRDDGIKGIVLDFIQDKNKNWVLIDCKEYSLIYKLTLDANIIEERKSTPSISTRSRSCDLKKSSTKIEIDKKDLDTSFIIYKEHREKTNELPFKIRAKPKEYLKPEVQEKDLMERISKVNARIDRIVSHKPSVSLSSMDLKEQSIQAYKIRYNSRSLLSPIPSNNPFLCPPKTNQKIENASFIRDSLNSDKNHLCIRKHYKSVIDTLDEAKFNTKLSKVNKNLLEKYGGEQFWNQFILSLYNKILANEALTKYFKQTKLDTFAMIMNGMLMIFNGMVNLEFRRAIRSSHQKMGITDREFEYYADIFEGTLIEFQVEDVDRQLIMSQIKSMKCLITKNI